jgi:large subunit ribosomal protein L32e
MDAKELLKKRRMLKRKKPSFIRQDAHKKKKLTQNWRRPKGSDSKMRVSRRGYKRSVRVGWGSPSAVRGLDTKGLLPVVVNNIHALQKIDSKNEVMVLSSGLGTKKKMAIIEQAMSKNIQIANCKDPETFLKEIKEKFDKKKKEKEKIKEERSKKKEAAKKEAAKKEEDKKKTEEKEEKKKTETKSKAESEKKTEEDKMEEKKEKDKLLITTQ